jgi:hypothetical protein
MNNPWFLLAVMSLATFILTKLVVDLDFPPVLWLRDRVVGGWRPLTLAEAQKSPLPVVREGQIVHTAWLGAMTQTEGVLEREVIRTPWIPLFFSELMSCPWCTSGWLSAGVTGGTWLIAGLPVPVLMWLGSWALGALMAQHDYA